jgi:hypothetical protein
MSIEKFGNISWRVKLIGFTLLSRGFEKLARGKVSAPARLRGGGRLQSWSRKIEI